MKHILQLGKFLFKLILSARRTPPDRITGYASFEPAVIDPEILENTATRAGYPPLAEKRGGGGGGFNTQRGRNVYGGGGYGSGGEPASTRETAFGSGYGYSEYGYVFYENNYLRIFPTYGVGGYGGGIDDKDTSRALRTGGMIGLIGVGIELVSPRILGIGLMIGVRLGIRFNPLVLKDVQFPDTAFRLFWVKLVLGFDRKSTSKTHE